MHLSCFTTWHAFATVCVFHLQLHHIVFHHLILRWQHAVVAMTLLPVQDQVRNQGRNKIDDSMQSLLRPCCLSYFSSLFVCVCCGLAADSCFAMQPFAIKLVCNLPPSTFSSPFHLSRWPHQAGQEAMQKLWTQYLHRVLRMQGPPQNGVWSLKRKSLSTTWQTAWGSWSSKMNLTFPPQRKLLSRQRQTQSHPKPKEPDVSTTAAAPTSPPANAIDPPPATDPPSPPAADQTATNPTDLPAAKKTTAGLSALHALEPLEATEGEGPKPTLMAKPVSKAAAVTKVAVRQRPFLD